MIWNKRANALGPKSVGDGLLAAPSDRDQDQMAFNTAYAPPLYARMR